jgi:hypothetical protein
MPLFNDFTAVNIDVDDFLQECDLDEIQEAIEWLRDEEHLTNDDLRDTEYGEPTSVLQQLFEEDLVKIKRAYLQISKEDFEAINRIAKKY